MLDFVQCDAAALCSEYDCGRFGDAPPQAAIDELVKWLQNQAITDVLATDQLAALYPAWQPYQHMASGALILPISAELGEYILWFRQEQVQTVNWAGEPTKPVEVTEHGVRLSPRKSFELWKQTVEGRSLAWQPHEIAAVEQLRTAMIEVVIRKAEELARVNSTLSRSNADLDAFAYVASHDLKEPLRGIHNYAHFLLEDYAEQLDATGKDYVNTMLRLTQRMNTLIESLLQFSQIGRVNLAMKTVDLNAAVSEIVDDLRVSIQQANATVTVHDLPTMYCDSVRVGQIFYNLIANAIKYNTHATKMVKVGVYRLAELAPEWLPPNDRIPTEPIFYVRDNGIGIPEQQYDMVFRMFKRLHGRDQYGGGTGVGLAIVKKIVERHDGALWLHSTVGVGTTFFFTLQG